MLMPVEQFRAFSEAVKQAGLPAAPATIGTGIKSFLGAARKGAVQQPSAVSQAMKTPPAAAPTPAPPPSPNIMA